VEIDPIHACIHGYNFPDCTVIPQSVRDLSGADIRQLAGITGKVSVVCGCAPCQGFSMIGTRMLDDPRNPLVKDFVRLVAELDADYFVFENVKGLTVGQPRFLLDEIIAAFAACGYAVRLPWSVLNAAAYGVPQDRRRLFLLGAKRSLPLPLYPPPLTIRADAAGGQELVSALPCGPTCWDALGDLPDADSFQTLLRSDEVLTKSWGSPSAYAREMR